MRARDSEPIVGTRGPGRGLRLRARRGFAGSRMGAWEVAASRERVIGGCGAR